MSAVYAEISVYDERSEVGTGSRFIDIKGLPYLLLQHATVTVFVTATIIIIIIVFNSGKHGPYK